MDGCTVYHHVPCFDHDTYGMGEKQMSLSLRHHLRLYLGLVFKFQTASEAVIEALGFVKSRVLMDLVSIRIRFFPENI